MPKTLRSTLLQNGQSHLLAHLEQLDAQQQAEFRLQLEAVDWARVASMHRLSGPQVAPQIPSELGPIASTSPTPAQRTEYWQTGLNLLAQGKAAFVLMAGGQGSRLGFEGPKGACPLGLPDDLVLFEVLVRRLLRLAELSGRLPPFAVMTGPENDQQTRDWFAHRQGPQIPAAWPDFFLQTAAPALDCQGQALVSTPGQLALVPDGNGGIWERLQDSGLLSQWREQGIEWIHVAGVDNLLSLPCDPVFLGFAHASGAPLACKSVLRTDPSEKVGVYALEAQQLPRVAEYTELPPQTAAALAADQLPVFREANIASHLLRLELASTFAQLPLPWHLARKKVPHLDLIPRRDSDELDCKYERFLFDAFPAASAMAVLRVTRETEFAPVKNAHGPDSPQTARDALFALHQIWKAAWNQSQNPPWVDPLASFAGESPTKSPLKS